MNHPRPSFPDTLTAEAEAEIAAAVQDVENARDMVKDRLDDLYGVLRKHYAERVDVRDLRRATSAGGTFRPLSNNHLHRIVKGVVRKPPPTE